MNYTTVANMNIEKVVVDGVLKDVTPELAAEMFAIMNAHKQAIFFNKLAELISKWDNGMGSFAMQLQYITDEEELTTEGRRVMELIGEYAKEQEPLFNFNYYKEQDPFFD
jgi:hypothetical protein